MAQVRYLLISDKINWAENGASECCAIPGITWSPMFRGPNNGEEGVEQAFHRIDRLYLKNPVNAAGGWSLRPVAGAVLPLIWEDDMIPIEQRMFPSDHGALLMDFEWVRLASSDVVNS